MRKGRETKGTRKIEIKEEREWQSAEVFTVPAAGVRTARGHAVSCWIARLWVIVATAGRSRPEKGLTLGDYVWGAVAVPLSLGEDC